MKLFRFVVYCLFVFVCSLKVLSHTRHFFIHMICRRHHYEGRAVNVDLYSTLMIIEQRGFFSVAHLLWHPFIRSSSRMRDTQTCYRAFSSGSVSFNDLHVGLSRLGFKHVYQTSHKRSKRSNRLRQRRGVIYCKTLSMWHQFNWRFTICTVWTCTTCYREKYHRRSIMQ